MWNNPNIFLNKKPNIDKLIQYGFKCENEVYSFSKDIAENTFCLNVYITQSGVTKFEVIDKDSSDEYTLIFSSSAVGSFVSSVRSECENILNDIVEQCYEPHIFKSEYAKLVISYIKKKYHAEAEYLWEKFPNNAVFRESKTEKWFAALLTVEKRKIGINADGTIEIIDLKESPEKVLELVDGMKYFSGYHMNKKHWYTICLDESVPIEEICVRIDKSFNTLLRKN